MADDARALRQALLVVALNKKCDKIQQKIHTKINKTSADFETALLDYMNVVNKLKITIELAERHQNNLKLQKLLRESADLVKNFSAQFAMAYEMFDSILPVSSINPDWMNNIDKQEKRLIKIKDTLTQIQMFPCNREVIEIVQRMVMQITDIQEKIKVSSEKVRDLMHETIKYGSNALNNQQINQLESSEDDISFVADESTNSFCQ